MEGALRSHPGQPAQANALVLGFVRYPEVLSHHVGIRNEGAGVLVRAFFSLL